MPAVAAALFAPVMLLAIIGLDLAPPPSAAEVLARGQRGAVGLAEQKAFLREFGAAVGLTALAYMVLRGLQDFRADFQAGVVLFTALAVCVLSHAAAAVSSFSSRGELRTQH